MEGRNTREFKERQKREKMATLAREVGLGLAFWAMWEGANSVL